MFTSLVVKNNKIVSIDNGYAKNENLFQFLNKLGLNFQYQIFKSKDFLRTSVKARNSDGKFSHYSGNYFTFDCSSEKLQGKEVEFFGEKEIEAIPLDFVNGEVTVYEKGFSLEKVSNSTFLAEVGFFKIGNFLKLDFQLGNLGIFQKKIVFLGLKKDGFNTYFIFKIEF